jgi:class 3 adenylate cyclase/tetratricopeptide (TPR) repeat protein
MDAHSERRVITALFIDVVGSTDLMMRVGPEVMRRRLADAFDQMSSRIAEHGGTVENYVGDAVVAIFGAPSAHIDDPERALHAAHACAQWSTDVLGKDRFSIRAGIETGEALVDQAAVQRRERMAIGPCVNIAARLQQQADPGQIVVGPACYEATAAIAEFEDLGDVVLKGLGDLRAWRFLDFSSASEGTRVPFVGRDVELKVLHDAADAATLGAAVLALIVGDPGLGKSRLARELVETRRATAAVRVLDVRCRPAGEEGENTPLRQLLAADIQGPTPASVRRRLVDLLGPDEGELTAVPILHSVGIEANPELQAITRYEQRETIARAWLGYLSALAEERLLIVAVEDVHWADPVLVRMLDHLSAEARAPILVIATARPEFLGSAHLRAAENRIHIELKPLDSAAAQSLAEAARGNVAGLDRAEGNPLFIIELARARSAAVDLPMTIQAAIAARLDELSPEERQLLQQAAVAGETFDVRDASLLADREPAEVAGMLGRVAHLGFVHRVGQAYRFHHALVRDVAYGRLPVSTRLSLHARYAEAGARPTDVVARAFHSWEAAKPPDAEWVWEDRARLEELRRRAYDAQLGAGKELESRNQYEQAEEVYQRAVELADGAQQRAEAQAELGRAMARQGRGDDAWATRLAAIESYQEAGRLPPSHVYADMLEIATMNWGYFHELPDDSEVVRLLGEGEARARASGDHVSLTRLLMQRAAFTGDLSGTDEVVGFLDSEEPVKFADACHRMATVLTWAGQLKEALELYRRVFKELLPRGAVINEPEATIWYGLAAFHGGDLDLAQSVADRAQADLAKGRSLHTQSHVWGLRALVALGRGDWDGLAAAGDLDELIAGHPDVSFCLVSGFALGYGAAGHLIKGLPIDYDLDAEAARRVEESQLVRASAVLLPKAMLGDADAVERGLSGYAQGLRLYDRSVAWDVTHMSAVIGLTILERWDMLAGPLARLDHCAAGGSQFAAALANGVREEFSSAQGGPPPLHAELRSLGYNGISELLRYRARPPLATAA